VHPVLLEIPLPRSNVALTPWLVVLALLALVVSALGRRAKNPDLFWVGLIGFALAFLSAVIHRGERAEIGPLTVYSFGALLSCALVAGSVVTVQLARAGGLPARATVNACVAATVAGFFGARLLYVLTNARDFRTFGEVVAFQSGGLTFYGGAVAGALGALWVLRRHRVAFLAWADAASPGLALSIAVGRVGCYLAGCDYGTPLSARAPAWIKRMGTFPRWHDDVAGPAAGSPAWVEHVLSGRVPLAAKASLPVHPAELYEAVIALVLFIGLVALRRFQRSRGQSFVALVLAYGIARFALESIRGDPERGLWGPLSVSQWAAVALSIPLVFAARRFTWRSGSSSLDRTEGRSGHSA
jgi:phosphatidylglycerol:prolipoprotein diacylglycerol transferase